MNLSNDRFYGPFELTVRLVEYPPYASDIKVTRYTYETGKKLYDVNIPERSVRNANDNQITRWYAINGQSQIEPERIHRLIEAHFNL